MIDAPPNPCGRANCAKCSNGHMRQIQVGPGTVHFGQPPLRCRIDGAFRSPELARDCEHFGPILARKS